MADLQLAPLPAFTTAANTRSDPCVYSAWTDWTPCPCTYRYEEVAHSVSTRKLLQGSPEECTEPLKRTRDCDVPGEPCADAECKLSEWKEWSPCPECGETEWTTRYRDLIWGPEDCMYQLKETKLCEIPFCNLCELEGACERSASTCTFSTSIDYPHYECHCFIGYTYSASQDQLENGCRDCCVDIDECSGTNQCSDLCVDGFKKPDNYTCGCTNQRYLLNDKRNCTSCEYGEWSAWTPCDAPCGIGATKRYRSPINESAKHSECKALEETDQCQIRDCSDSDCMYSSWSEWSDCSAPCGGGTQSRSQTLDQGLDSCEKEITESQTCNTQECAKARQKWYKQAKLWVAICCGAAVAFAVLLIFVWRHIKTRAREDLSD